jgi:hypothetical protein
MLGLNVILLDFRLEEFKVLLIAVLSISLVTIAVYISYLF